MSIYASFDEKGATTQIATNLGWTQFGNWADSLKETEFPLVRKMWLDAECLDLPGLRKELDQALKKGVVDADAVDVAHAIIYAIDAAGKADFLLVTNGMVVDNAAS
jgi:hypothetical protein